MQLYDDIAGQSLSNVLIDRPAHETINSEFQNLQNEVSSSAMMIVFQWLNFRTLKSLNLNYSCIVTD